MITPTKLDYASTHRIDQLDEELLEHFQSKLVVEPALSRSVVSFQANKDRQGYRWFKYREGFSASLVEYLLSRYSVQAGPVLDPFAGSGTVLFSASDHGLDADGIELLPIGWEIIGARQLLATEFEPSDIQELEQWVASRTWERSEKRSAITELRITTGAYPQETKESIECFLGAIQQVNEKLQVVLRFALLSVLESISYTRKDGQYLRWDYRSGRVNGTRQFDKGTILSFGDAINAKVSEMARDVRTLSAGGNNSAQDRPKGTIALFKGSCLNLLPLMQENNYTAIVTSPPYGNRYDYTRTYALELALLGLTEAQLIKLRQDMVSCTVENRSKDLFAINPSWSAPISVVSDTELLRAILNYLEELKGLGQLNNNGIPRMLRGYFYEMACVIYECARVLKPGSPFFMVNDNVKYAGVGISVDLLLSHFAEQLGFYIEEILVLPMGKGNSSQQMGEHGRESLRKCVYVWRKK